MTSSRRPWTVARYRTIRDRVAQQIEQVRSTDPQSVLPTIFTAMEQHLSQNDGEADMTIVALALEALLFNGEWGGLSRTQSTQLQTEITGRLRLHNISPQSSKLAWIYGELATACAATEAKTGQTFASLWSSQLGYLRSGKSRRPIRVYSVIRQAHPRSYRYQARSKILCSHRPLSQLRTSSRTVSHAVQRSC